MGMVKDLTNQRFGRLVVLRPTGRNASRHVLWECLCDCGNLKTVPSNSLQRGATTSCGCFATEVISQNNVRYKTKHGQGTSRAYNTWSQMKQRCDNPNHEFYRRYGGRGISYCEKWSTFEGFWEDMKDEYSDNLTLDRKDNNKGYSKENCRWATFKEQANNKSTNTFITFNGETDTLTNMAAKYGISIEAASWRLKQNWSMDEVFLRPLHSFHKQYKKRQSQGERR